MMMVTATELLGELRVPTSHRAKADLTTSIAALKAKGLSNGEIARILGLSQDEVALTVSSVGFARILVKFLDPRSLDKFILTEGINSLVCLAQLRDDPSIPPNVRATCAKELANRAFGQPREVREVSFSSEPQTPAEILDEIRKLEEELKLVKHN